MNKLQNDFLEAIQDAIKNKEHEKVVSLLTNEVGALLAKNKLALVRVVQRSGKDISDNISDNELAKIVSSGIINKNEKFLTNLIETIVNEKATHSNIINIIIKYVGALVKGIGDSVASGQKAQAEKVVAKEGVKQAEHGVKKAKTELASGIISAKSRAKQASYEIDAKQQKELGEQDKTMKIVLAVTGFSILGLVMIIAYKKVNSNNA